MPRIRTLYFFFRRLLPVLLLNVFLTACGGGGDSGGGEGSSFDRSGAQAKVEEGRTLLENSIDAYTTDAGTPPFPYADMTGVEVTFGEAEALDPTLDEASFWGAVFELVRFLQSEASQTFLSKLGWQDLSLGTEFENFSDRFGQIYNENLGTPDPLDPPLGDFGMPTDPDDEAIAPIIFFGTEFFVDLRFDELYDFLTVDLANSARSAVDRLKPIEADFQTSLTLDDGVEQRAFQIDRFEASVVQVFYGALETVALLPSLWNFPGFDDFYSASSTRDPITGAFIDPGTGSIDDISDAELTAYFQSPGIDGIPGSGDEPLSANPGGIARLKQALGDLFSALQSALTYLINTADMSGHLFDLSLVFDTYDQEADAIRYGLKSYEATAAEVKTAFTTPGGGMVNLYQPVAFITGFTTCTPGGTSTTVAAIGNVPPIVPFPAAPTDLTNVIPLGALDLNTPVVTVTVLDTAPTHADGSYYASVTLSGTANVSIYTSGVDLDTSGAVAYQTTGRLPQLAGWDSDEDAGANQNFGISIDLDYFNPADMPSLPAVAVTLYLRIFNNSGGTFTLHVVTDLDGAWPTAEPIFLKGGNGAGGRNFMAETFSLGSARVDLGALVDLMGNVWDLSQRDTLAFIPDDPGTPLVDETATELFYANTVLRGEVLAVFPQADFTGSSIEFPGDTNVFEFVPDFDVPGFLPLPAASAPAPQFGPFGPFRAYPQDLTPTLEHAGGFGLLF